MIVEKNPFEQPTVEDLIGDYLSEKEKKPFVGIVHRLDRVTSGVLLIAKRKSALRHLNQQFADRTISKTYLAILAKAPPQTTGRLDHWLQKDQKNKKSIIWQEEREDAQIASLRYEVIEEKNGRFLTEVILETGRYHQIRAQFAAIGCPIVGDEKYGSTIDPAHRNIALHAASLTFVNPETEETNTIKAPPPNERWWQNFIL